MSVIPALVVRRTTSFAYLKEVFSGDRHWVSIVSLTKDEEQPDDPQGAHTRAHSLSPHSRARAAITTT